MDAEELNARYSVRNVVPAGTTVGRRRFMELLAGAGASAALLGTIDRSALAFAATTAEPPTWVPSFPDGVMSGDPSHDGSVLWTRLGAPVEETPIEVTWEVAADDGFTSLVAGGSAQAVAANGYTVKVAVTGLDADSWYHYRFRSGDTTVTGRTRTAPAPGSSPTQLKFAWASCQQISSRRNGDRSRYLAHRSIAAEEDLDFWMHLGDYVYVSDGGTLTVDNYRGVYERFKADPDLQALQATVPTVAMFDDGEFVNGVHRGIPAERLANALQVWFEQFPVIPPEATPTEAHRKFVWGDLLDVFMLDVRQYRDPEVLEGNPQQNQDRQRFDPARTTLGTAQRNWLKTGLADTEAIWKVLGNPYNMAMWRLSKATQPGRGQTFTSNFRDLNNVHVNQGTYAPNEAWDDFWWERRNILESLSANGVDNVVSVSGHTHIWLADVLIPNPDDPASPVVAFDFTCGSLTADPDFTELNYGGINFNGNAPFAYSTLQTIAGGIEELNPWKAYCNFINQGYGLATFTRDEAIIEFKAVDTFAAEPATDLLARFTIKSGERRMRVELWPAPCYPNPSTPLTPVMPSRLFPPAVPWSKFTDVPPSASHATAVNWMAAAGVTSGVAPGRFGPEQPVTRGQVALFLWRFMGKPVPSRRANYADLTTAGDLRDAVDWMDEAGVTRSSAPPGSRRRFDPAGRATRAQMAAFLWRLAGEPTGAPPAAFTDVRRPGWQAGPIDWAAFNRITVGLGGTSRFDPEGTVTRAQVASFLYRLAGAPSAWSPEVALPDTVRRLPV